MIVERYLRRQLRSLPESVGQALADTAWLRRLAKVRQVVYLSSDIFQQQSPRVSQFFAVQDQTLVTKQRVLQVAASLAAASQVPLLKAVHEAAKEASLPVREAEIDAQTGQGVLGRLDRTWYVLGEEAIMRSEAVELGAATQALMQQLELAGKQLLFLAQKQPKRLLAIFACESEVSAEVERTVRELDTLGVEQVLLASEKTRQARALAGRVGIQLVHAELEDEERSLLAKALYEKNPTSLLFVVPAKGSPALPEGAASYQLGAGSSLTALPAQLKAARQVIGRARRRLFWCKIDSEESLPSA